MSLISDEDQKFLKDKFANDLTNPVKITFFTQGESPLSVPGPECAYCKDTRQLLEEIDALSDKISLEIHDFVADSDEAKQYGIDKIPAITLDGGSGGRARYFGIPAGYEFGTLIEDIVDASTGKTKLAPETKAALQKLDKDVHIQVFVTPT